MPEYYVKTEKWEGFGEYEKTRTTLTGTSSTRVEGVEEMYDKIKCIFKK
jgi:hypothetical protein